MYAYNPSARSGWIAKDDDELGVWTERFDRGSADGVFEVHVTGVAAQRLPCAGVELCLSRWGLHH